MIDCSVSLAGRVFGRLSVVGEVSKLRPYGKQGKRRSCWQCLCDCGTETWPAARNLLLGATTSCGGHKRKYITPYEKILARKFWSAKNSTILTQRNLDFTLTQQQCVVLFESSCHYCANDPLCGIDRVDNSKGYIPENVVPCCTNCNVAKNEMSKNDFIDMCRRVTAKHSV